MNDWLFSALADYGAPLLGLVTLLSCLALPIPASLVMLAAGAFAASGDLHLGTLFAFGLGGALCGDQLGYTLGQGGQNWLAKRLSPGSRTLLAMARADAFLHQRGPLAVFLSRWLLSPLGPYVNFAAGAARLNRLRFSLADLAGEIIWISTYLGLGYSFAAQIAMVGDIAQSVIGLLAGSGLAIGAGLWLIRAARRARLAGDRDAPHI